MKRLTPGLLGVLAGALLISSTLTVSAQQKKKEQEARKAAHKAEVERKKQAVHHALKAIRENDPATLKKTIEEYPFLLKWKDKAHTPLINLAAMSDCIDCVGVLLDAGAGLDATDMVKRNPIHCAAGWSTLEMVQYLVKRGADINKRTKRGETPLGFARNNYHGHNYKERIRIMNWLIKQGAH